MQTIVEKNGLLLRFAAPSLQDDKELVCSAVKENGLAIQYVSDLLQNDEKVQALAQQQNPYALLALEPPAIAPT